MKNKLNPNCGVRLRECREAIGMTQKQLADAIHTTYQSISNIERGVRRLTVENARLAARVLGVRMEYLLCEDDIKSISDYPIEKFRANEELDNHLLQVLDGLICTDQYDAENIILWKTKDDDAYGSVKHESAIICSREDVQEIVNIIEGVLDSWYENKLEKQNKQGVYKQSELIDYLDNNVNYYDDDYEDPNYTDLAAFLEDNVDNLTEDKIKSYGLTPTELEILMRYVDDHSDLYGMIKRVLWSSLTKTKSSNNSNNDMPNDYKLWKYKELTENEIKDDHIN